MNYTSRTRSMGESAHRVTSDNSSLNMSSSELVSSHQALVDTEIENRSHYQKNQTAIQKRYWCALVVLAALVIVLATALTVSTVKLSDQKSSDSDWSQQIYTLTKANVQLQQQVDDLTA